MKGTPLAITGKQVRQLRSLAHHLDPIVFIGKQGITPTIVSLTGACGLRVVWIFTVFVAMHSLFILYLSYPVTWVITWASHMICFMVLYRRKKLPAAAGQKN